MTVDVPAHCPHCKPQIRASVPVDGELLRSHLLRAEAALQELLLGFRRR
jgi:hypothetical protein